MMHFLRLDKVNASSRSSKEVDWQVSWTSLGVPEKSPKTEKCGPCEVFNTVLNA